MDIGDDKKNNTLRTISDDCNTLMKTRGDHLQIENVHNREKLSHDRRKRKTSTFNSTVIGKNSITELAFMVEQHENYKNFLLECGKLSDNREKVISKEIANLTAIIKHKQSVVARDCVHKTRVNIPLSFDTVSPNNYN